jgi:hypothetical protein
MNTAGMGGQMMPVSQGSSPTDWLQQNFDPNDSITENGVQKFRSVTDGNYYTPDQAYQMYNNQSGFQRTSETSTSTNDGGGSCFGFKTPNFIKGIEDKAKGLVGGVTGTFKGKYDQDGNLLQAPTIDPKLLALALGYGKITRDAAIRQSGGMQDIRETLRPDLAQQEVYNPGGGFDVGLGNRSLLTMPMAPTQGMPIEASYETMPNAPVGTPMPERFIRGAANGGIIQAYAVGGQVIDMRNGGESEGPGTGTSDDIPAMLSDGEFVMTAKATRGAGAFDVAEQDGGIMLLPTGEASREKGTDNMTTLMETFARYG